MKNGTGAIYLHEINHIPAIRHSQNMHKPSIEVWQIPHEKIHQGLTGMLLGPR